MHPDPKISVSLVLYNTNAREFRAIRDSVLSSSVPLVFFVVDNSPVRCVTDEDLNGVRYSHLPDNPGYGGGHNYALRIAMNEKFDFHFVVNPDISFGRFVLEDLVGFMEDVPDIGCAMPKIVYPDGRIQRLCKLLPTPGNLFLRRFPVPFLSRLTKRQNDRYELLHWSYDTVADIPILSGCFMAIRVEALRKVGLFDQRYFMYLEDYDLVRRIGSEYRTVYFPRATVVHDHRRASFHDMRMLVVHLSSAVKYFNKWGWFLDRERRLRNSRALKMLGGGSD